MFVCLFVYITWFSCYLIIYFSDFLCRFVNNISNNNGTPEVIAEFDVDVFTQETPVKKNKAKKSANILVRNIS